MFHTPVQHTTHDFAQVAHAPAKFDEVGFIAAYEDGLCDDETLITGFQALIDSGKVWSLQGFYGRMASALIESGDCHAA